MRAANENAVGLDASLVDGAHRGLAVVGVDEDAVGQHLQPCPETLEPALDAVALPVCEAQLDDLALDVLVDQLPRGALGHDPCPGP